MAMKLVRKRSTLDGFADPRRPDEEIPEITINVDLLTDDELMYQLNLFTAWADYLAVETAKAAGEEERLEDLVEDAKAMAVLEGTLGLNKDRAKGVLDNRELRMQYRVARNVRKLVEAKAGNCARDALAMSRELTRRTELFRTDRGRRWGP